MSYIQDNELLYRSFPVPDTRSNPPILHFRTHNGAVTFSRSAFNDKHKEPSVDRAELLSCPKDVVFSDNDGVIQLIAKQVRDIIQTGRKHDAVPDPKENRPAHALIKSDPTFSNKVKEWKNFQELLAIAATQHGWVIEPVYDEM